MFSLDPGTRKIQINPGFVGHGYSCEKNFSKVFLTRPQSNKLGGRGGGGGGYKTCETFSYRIWTLKNCTILLFITTIVYKNNSAVQGKKRRLKYAKYFNVE